ncbi:MAG: CHASE domain-containing protein [Burkholderiaceae bacterium]
MLEKKTGLSDVDALVEPAYPNLLRMERILKWRRVGQWLPLLVFLGALVVTYLASRQSHDVARRALDTEFDFRVRESNRQLDQRMQTYKQVLRGMLGLFVAEGRVTREQFHDYFQTLHLEASYPGIQGIGFVELVRPPELARHLVSVRREGFPEYVIKPPGQRDVYSAIVYIEPFSGRNLRAFGYDMFSEPTRRAAMEQARDSGHAAVSSRLRLVQENGTDVQDGFIMCLPVYRKGAPHATVAQRRDALVGWLEAPFRMKDLIAGLNGERGGDLDIEIYDGTATTPENRMLDLYPGVNARNAAYHLSRLTRMEIGGRVWTVITHATEAFHSKADLQRSQLVAGVGVVISLLLAALTWLFVDDRLYAMRAARQALQLAMYDALTGLPNRKLMINLIRKMLASAQREEQMLALMFIDLDHFKPVNDGFGHGVGDLLLQNVAQRLRESVREADTVARIGGDEFVVLLPHIDRHGAAIVAEKILDGLARPFMVAGESFRISSSIGIALYPEDGVDETRLIRNADAAMYRAKERGRNQAVFFRPA